MKKASEYRQRADQCRILARAAKSPQHREMLLDMAATWDGLAEDRMKQAARSKRITKLEGSKAEQPRDA
jgi:hypothetical protein